MMQVIGSREKSTRLIRMDKLVQTADDKFVGTFPKLVIPFQIYQSFPRMSLWLRLELPQEI